MDGTSKNLHFCLFHGAAATLPGELRRPPEGFREIMLSEF